MNETEAPVWAILELMGHRQLAGRISEVQRFGVTLCQIEMDREPGEEPVVQFYGGPAIFGLTITTEATVRRMQVRGQFAGPVQIQPLKLALLAPEPDDVGAPGAEPGEAEIGATWCEAVDAYVADPHNAPKPGPAPVDALAAFIRESGGLDESQALALLQELQEARIAGAPLPW